MNNAKRFPTFPTMGTLEWITLGNLTTMTTFIVFDHRKRTQEGRPGPLEVRISIKRKKWYINTGVKVLQSEWRAGQVVRRPDCDVLNERLRILTKSIDEEVNDRLQRGVPIDVSEIRNAVWGVSGTEELADCCTVNTPFLEWFEERLQVLRVSRGTLRHYKTTLAHLRACGYINRWRDLTTENIYRFDAYLHKLRIHNSVTRANGKDVCLKQGTIYNQHKNLKAMISRAVVEGKCDYNPYEKMRGVFSRGDIETVEYLTLDELKCIEALDVPEGDMLALAKDLFVFQAYTGMAFSDMQAFSLKDCRHSDERWLLSKQRVKTGMTYYIQLLPPALAVVNKYGGAMPRVVCEVYNRALKKLAMMAGIRKRVTSHVARHTFATWMLHEEVPIERVAKMLGHSDIKQTQRYAKVLAQDVFGEFDRIERKKSGR